MNLKLARKVILLPLILGLSIPVHAQTFNYNLLDLLVCFRNIGSSPVNDLVVDAGPVSTFTNLAIGGKIVITQFTGSQLAAVGTNSAAWSSFACDNNNSSSPQPYCNLWLTRPRVDLNTQSSPWVFGNFNSQAPVAGKIDSIGNDATTIGSLLPPSGNNTATALVEAESGHKQSDNGCYAFYIGTLGNFGNTFQGNIEQTTPANFTTAGQPVRADFYQLLSTNNSITSIQAVKYLGYFELATNGVLTYTAGPSPAVLSAPVITAITRTGTTNTITFTTGFSGTYSLRGTNVLTASPTNWPVIGSTPGNGSAQSLNDVPADSQKFYIISAQ